MGQLASNYLPEKGRIYELGAATGNIGRVLAPTVTAGHAELIAIEDVPDMAQSYVGPGSVKNADMRRYPFKPFDVAISFLSLMFLPVQDRRDLVVRLREQMRPGGAMIIFERTAPPGGYLATVLSRLTWCGKLDGGADAASIVERESQLQGVQWPFTPANIGSKMRDEKS